MVGKRLCGKFLLPQALRFARILFKQAGVTDTCWGYRSLKYIAMLFFFHSRNMSICKWFQTGLNP